MAEVCRSTSPGPALHISRPALLDILIIGCRSVPGVFHWPSPIPHTYANAMHMLLWGSVLSIKLVLQGVVGVAVVG